MQFAFVSESFETPTNWRFNDPEHIVVVHRTGALSSMEMAFEHSPSGRALPRSVISGSFPRSGAIPPWRRGVRCRFCEIQLSATLFGDRKVPPIAHHRDVFALHLVERMHTVIGRDDPLAHVLCESLAETLRMHHLVQHREEAEHRHRTCAKGSVGPVFSTPRRFATTFRAKVGAAGPGLLPAAATVCRRRSGQYEDWACCRRLSAARRR